MIFAGNQISGRILGFESLLEPWGGPISGMREAVHFAVQKNLSNIQDIQECVQHWCLFLFWWSQFTPRRSVIPNTSSLAAFWTVSKGSVLMPLGLLDTCTINSASGLSWIWILQEGAREIEKRNGSSFQRRILGHQGTIYPLMIHGFCCFKRTCAPHCFVRVCFQNDTKTLYRIPCCCCLFPKVSFLSLLTPSYPLGKRRQHAGAE